MTDIPVVFVGVADTDITVKVFINRKLQKKQKPIRTELYNPS